tara:strand:- start:346 stop:3159 length:2814 start_codon:yes stop_codon:yes gene_type:complete
MASVLRDCGTISSNFKKLAVDIKKWASSDRNAKLFNDPYTAAFGIVNAHFGIDLQDLTHTNVVTPGARKDVMDRLNEFSKSVEKGSISQNQVAEFMFSTSHYAKRDPIINQIIKDFQSTSFQLQKNDVRDKSSMKSILTSLRAAAGVESIVDKGMAALADKELEKLGRKRIDAWVKLRNGDASAQKEFDNVTREIKQLVDSSYLKIYEDAINIIEGGVNSKGEEYGIPLAIKKKFESLEKKAKDDISKGNKYTSKVKLYNSVKEGSKILKLEKSDIRRYVKNKDGTDLNDNMSDAIITYSSLMDNLYVTLRNGINKRIDSIIDRMKFNGDNRSAEQFKEIKKEMQGMYMPKYEQNYFPHYTRDLNVDFMDGLMKSFDDMQSSANVLNLKSKDPSDIINNIKLHIDDHAKRRQESETDEGRVAKYDYSRNFFNTISNYISDVNRFNFKSFNDAHLIDSLSAIERIYKKEGSAKGYAESLTNYILDMTKASNGDYDMDPNTKAIMRTILSQQFVAKLGANPRGAVRNFTQRFLDYVEWGPIQIRQMKRYLKDMTIQGKSAESYIESVLNDMGLLFEESSPQVLETQLARDASVSRIMEFDSEQNKWISRSKGKLERIADASGAIAAKTSWLHRKAENSNRKHTFKIAYAQMHKWLSNNKYYKKLDEQGIETDTAKEAVIRKKAEKYAVNMVLLNHFDYADYAKAKAMRTKPGRFLGQFQHYSFELFERNMKIVREAKYDLKTKNMNIFGDAQGLAKANRMAWIYFLAPMIAGSYMGVNFGNLIENDTVSRLNQLRVALTGDDDEINDAFYGKGPLLATFGGPAISDLIDIGMQMDLINLDNEGIETLFYGLQRRDTNKASTEMTRKLRFLNIFSSRFIERHYPLIAGGGFGWAVAAAQELGVYPTSEAMKAQKKLLKARKDLLPEELEKALSALERRNR